MFEIYLKPLQKETFLTQDEVKLNVRDENTHFLIPVLASCLGLMLTPGIFILADLDWRAMRLRRALKSH